MVKVSKNNVVGINGQGHYLFGFGYCVSLPGISPGLRAAGVWLVLGFTLKPATGENGGQPNIHSPKPNELQSK